MDKKYVGDYLVFEIKRECIRVSSGKGAKKVFLARKDMSEMTSTAHG